MKTKLEMIQASLAGNGAVTVVAVQHHCDGFGRAPFSHTVRICVAPKVGIYDAPTLNAFMLTLVPELKPSMVDEIYVGMGFRVGMLYFDEVVTVPAAGPSDDGGPSAPVDRRTWVAVYPDRVLAHSGADGKYRYEVPLSAIGESARIRTSLLADALGLP